MKNEKIIEALGGVDPRYIAQAAEYLPASASVRARPSRRRIALVAACAALMLVTLIFALPMMQPSTPESLESNELGGFWIEYLFGGGDKITSEGVLVEAWLRNISTKGYESYESRHTIAPEHVGEKLGDVEVYNRLYRYLDDTVSGEEYLDAEIFRIKGVDPAVSFCLRYTEQGEALTTTHYYVFCNKDASYRDLDDLRASLAAETYFSVGDNAVYATPASSETVALTRYGLDESLAASLREIFLTVDGESIERFDSTLFTDCRSQLQISVSIISDGSPYAHVYVLENGHLVYASKNGWEVFFIGTARTEEIIRLVRREGEKQWNNVTGIYAKPE